MMKTLPTKTKMLNIGITGGIGTGKTTVCKMFESLGIPVYNADERAKYLMNHEHFLIDQIQKHFGTESYVDGVLDRKLMAEKVFHNKDLLKLLNSIVHPAVFRDTERWTNEQASKKVPYALREAALLIETGSYKSLDKLIVVTAPLEKRLERIIERDNTSEDEVMTRVRNQMEEKDKLKLADYVIVNDKDLASLQQQVLTIHEQICNLAQKKNK